MGARETTISARDREILSSLESAIRNFERDAARAEELIRRLLEESGPAFYDAAVHVLRTLDDSRGAQFFLSTLADANLLVPMLAEADLSNQQALKVARTAMNCCQMLDVALARYLAGQVSTGSESLPPELQRLMEILCQISNVSRILPSLQVMARQQNAHIQSKAVLMVGRFNRSVKWLQSRLADSDPRVRANAVEALWGIDTPEARELLEKATLDGNNRVVGNAMVGLYRLGDSSAIAKLFQMSEHPGKLFRATAAWAMGETADPRFARVLARLLTEPNAGVRSRAFAALGRIRAASSSQAEPLRVGVVFEKSLRKGWRYLRVDVSSPDGKAHAGLLATNFVLTEDGQAPVNYAVEERAAPESLSVAFLFPRAGEPGMEAFQRVLLHMIEWKRQPALWALAPYRPVRHDIHARLAGQAIDFEAAAPPDMVEAPLAYSSDLEFIRTALVHSPPAEECGNLWSTIERAVQIEGGPVRGQRQIFIYSHGETSQPRDYAPIASSARKAQAAVHAVVVGDSSLLENLCRFTGGTVQKAATAEEAAALMERLYLSLSARYAVRYQTAVPAAGSLTIRVQSGSGRGETSVAIERGLDAG